jgi:MFS family permease
MYSFMLFVSRLSGAFLSPTCFTIQLTHIRARILAAAGSVDYLLFSILAYFVIERYGRRRVMMTSAAACSTCWIIITIVLALTESDPSNSYNYGAVAVAFFFVFFASFGMGVLGVPWLYPTEINALEMRTKGASLAMATNWVVSRPPSLISLVVPVLILKPQPNNLSR